MDLRHANVILKDASIFFAGPTTKRRSSQPRRLATSPMGSQAKLQSATVSPGNYYDAKIRPLSKRTRRDGAFRPELLQAHESNYHGVYSAKINLRQLHREAFTIPNCMVHRFMRKEELTSAHHDHLFSETTITDENKQQPCDLVDQQFVAAAPNRF